MFSGKTFRLKYKVTPADMKAVNKKLMWQYFAAYLSVALVGVVVGLLSITIFYSKTDRTEMLVFGITLLVLGAVLLACTVLLLIAPKNYVASMLLTSDELEREVIINDHGITIKTQDHSDIYVNYGEITRVKDKKQYILAYLSKDIILLIKGAIEEGGAYAELFAYLKEKTDKRLASKPMLLDNAAEADAAPDCETHASQDYVSGPEPEEREEQAEETAEDTCADDGGEA